MFNFTIKLNIEKKLTLLEKNLITFEPEIMASHVVSCIKFINVIVGGLCSFAINNGKFSIIVNSTIVIIAYVFAFCTKFVLSRDGRYTFCSSNACKLKKLHSHFDFLPDMAGFIYTLYSVDAFGPVEKCVIATKTGAIILNYSLMFLQTELTMIFSCCENNSLTLEEELLL